MLTLRPRDPPLLPHSFVSDALKFIIFMFVIGLLFYIWSIVSLVRFHTHAGEIIFKYLDMITVAVPPALAACLTIATTVAIGRLNEKRVFVSQPNVINMAGLLDVMCFDKTGTLTEPGLDLKGLVPVTPMDGKGNGKGTAPAFERLVTTVDGLRPEYQELCALCHGLAKLGEQVRLFYFILFHLPALSFFFGLGLVLFFSLLFFLTFFVCDCVHQCKNNLPTLHFRFSYTTPQ